MLSKRSEKFLRSKVNAGL